MDRVPLPDLNNLDRDALLALYQAQKEKLRLDIRQTRARPLLDELRSRTEKAQRSLS
jgi:hypothetical protein